MLDGSVRARELSEVVACHLRPDLDSVEYLVVVCSVVHREKGLNNTNFAVVDTDDAANHFRDDDHVTEVCLDDCGLFIRGSFFLSFAQFLDQAHRAALEAATKPTAGACVNELLSRTYVDQCKAMVTESKIHTSTNCAHSRFSAEHEVSQQRLTSSLFMSRSLSRSTPR